MTLVKCFNHLADMFQGLSKCKNIFINNLKPI